MARANGTSPAGHTPGPWKSLRRECEFGCGDGAREYLRIVAPRRRDDIGRTFGCPEQEANARVMAEAPAMLAELQNVIRTYRSLETGDGINGSDLVKAMEEWVLPGVQRVVARAKGKAA